MRAIYDVGPWSGFRVYAEGDTTRPVLHLDMSARRQLLAIARDALEADTLRLISDGQEYDVDAGLPLASRILRAMIEQG
jgi:hypothetical protein